MTDAPYHAHIYYDDASRDAALALRERLRAAPGVRFVGSMTDRPIGPHPIPQFEVHFGESARADVATLIAQGGLTALIHPLTNDDLADHTTLAQWIGMPIALDLSVLDPPGKNQGVARFGNSDF